jgi:hypothetical protein
MAQLHKTYHNCHDLVKVTISMLQNQNYFKDVHPTFKQLRHGGFNKDDGFKVTTEPLMLMIRYSSLDSSSVFKHKFLS